MPQPGTMCCGCCPLLWGVRIIAWYTMIAGFHVILNEECPPIDHMTQQEANWVLVVYYNWYIINVLGVVIGFRGLIGVKLGDSVRVRELFLYYVLRICFDVPHRTVLWWTTCDILNAVKQTHHGHSIKLDCASVRSREIQNCIFEFGFEICFAHAAWSLACRLA